MPIVEFPNFEHAERHVLSVLDAHVSYFPFCVREAFLNRKDRGEFYLVLPEGAKLEPHIDLRYGGVNGTGGLLSALVLLLTQFLQHGDKGGIVFVEEFARRGDEALLRRSKPPVFFDDDVVFVADVRNARDERLLNQLAKETRTPHALIVLCDSVSESSAPHEIARFAGGGLQGIVVSAFDGEGYLLWMKHDPPFSLST